MTDEMKNGAGDDLKINVMEAWDVMYWCEELNLKAEELKDIVRLVGPAVHDVRLHLAKKLLVNWPVTY